MKPDTGPRFILPLPADEITSKKSIGHAFPPPTFFSHPGATNP